MRLGDVLKNIIVAKVLQNIIVAKVLKNIIVAKVLQNIIVATQNWAMIENTVAAIIEMGATLYMRNNVVFRVFHNTTLYVIQLANVL